MVKYNGNNIFAKILRGEVPCKKVLETEYALAFNDINPQTPTHVLVIPKGSYENLKFLSGAHEFLAHRLCIVFLLGSG